MPLIINVKRKKKIVFLVGPTATGKSETAVHLAKRLNAEILSCDSMQIYKGMDIVTCKPNAALRKKIPHHLVSAISPLKEYNVSQYRKDALKKIKGIIKRGKIPLFAGGTGLYASALIDGIFKAEAQDEGIRKKLYKQAKLKGSGFLHKRLNAVDPDAADKIHPNDTKRIIRALEVFEITGKPISQLQKQRKGLVSEYNVVIFGLNMERQRLYKRIEERIEEMFRQGMLSEVKKLLRTYPETNRRKEGAFLQTDARSEDAGVPPSAGRQGRATLQQAAKMPLLTTRGFGIGSKAGLSKTASYAIGIRELKGYFEGLYDLEEAKRLIKRNSRNFAKRQLTWFRKDKRIKWIKVNKNDSPFSVAGRIFKEF